jgi:hypothetical protein
LKLEIRQAASKQLPNGNRLDPKDDTPDLGGFRFHRPRTVLGFGPVR